ncbi:MAG: hypothetical protein AB7I79_07520 [Rhizobiaceae bacterium]
MRSISVRIAMIALATSQIAVPAGAEEEPKGAALAGAAFCELVLNDAGKGLLYLFTRPFAQLVDDALSRSDDIAEANPEEKPPFGDGIPFSSFPDRPTVCEVGAIVESATSGQVDIHYKFPETPTADWTDRLVLAPDDGHLKIDDILYGAQDYKIGLRAVAEEVLRQ